MFVDLLKAEGATNDPALRDWLDLLKPRVISLVVFTGLTGMAIAPRWPSPPIGLITILCICMGAGAAGAVNMWYDRDIDAVMKRTATRPIPSGRMGTQSTVIYAVIIAILSVIILWLATNLLAAGLLAFSIFFYSVIYTMWLKRNTPQNIVIGGAAGAFPPMIGWAASMDSLATLPVCLFAIIFLWTPPHFWSLALYACKDYDKAGIPMLPVVRGARHTRKQIMLYTIVLSLVSLIPSFAGQCGWFYTVTTSLLNLGFVYFAFRVLTEPQDLSGVSQRGDKAARYAFRYSLAYLFFLFCGVLIDRVLLPAL